MPQQRNASEILAVQQQQRTGDSTTAQTAAGLWEQ